MFSTKTKTQEFNAYENEEFTVRNIINSFKHENLQLHQPL